MTPLLAIPLLLTLSQPQAQPDPARFIAALYAPYRTSPDYSSLGSFQHEQTIYSASLIQLLRADRVHTPRGEQGALDADPLCQCQDSEGLQLDPPLLKPTSPGHVQAAVTLRFSSDPHDPATRLRLLLVQDPAGWRVDDVFPEHGPSLRKLLTRKH